MSSLIVGSSVASSTRSRLAELALLLRRLRREGLLAQLGRAGRTGLILNVSPSSPSTDEWLAHLERLVSWMSPTGVTVVVIQNRGTACMAMLDHFFGHQFDLDGLVSAFRAKHGDRYDVVTTIDPAHVETSEPASAYAVAEFMLNLLPISRPPTRRDVTAYLDRHCTTDDGTYRLSVHQDFLQIRARE